MLPVGYSPKEPQLVPHLSLSLWQRSSFQTYTLKIPFYTVMSHAVPVWALRNRCSAWREGRLGRSWLSLSAEDVFWSSGIGRLQLPMATLPSTYRRWRRPRTTAGVVLQHCHLQHRHLVAPRRTKTQFFCLPRNNAAQPNPQINGQIHLCPTQHLYLQINISSRLPTSVTRSLSGWWTGWDSAQPILSYPIGINSLHL